MDALDLVCYSINPQVHAFDNSSLIETLEAQAITVESTRQFADGLPIAVTPVTLLARFNPNATGPEPEPPPGELPTQVDVRQMSLFGAGVDTRQYQVSFGKRRIQRNLLRNNRVARRDGDRRMVRRCRTSSVPSLTRSFHSITFSLTWVNLAAARSYPQNRAIP